MDSQGHGQPKVTKGAPLRKRKNSSAVLGGAAKRHAQSRKFPDTAEERPGRSNAGPVFQVCHHPFSWPEASDSD